MEREEKGIFTGILGKGACLERALCHSSHPTPSAEGDQEHREVFHHQHGTTAPASPKERVLAGLDTTPTPLNLRNLG